MTCEEKAEMSGAGPWAKNSDCKDDRPYGMTNVSFDWHSILAFIYLLRT